MMPEATMTRSSLHAGGRCQGGARLVHAALLHELPELGVGHVLHAVQAPGRLRGDLHVVPGARVRHERLEPVQPLPLLLRRCREPCFETLSAPVALNKPVSTLLPAAPPSLSALRAAGDNPISPSHLENLLCKSFPGVVLLQCTLFQVNLALQRGADQGMQRGTDQGTQSPCVTASHACHCQAPTLQSQDKATVRAGLATPLSCSQ